MLQLGWIYHPEDFYQHKKGWHPPTAGFRARLLCRMKLVCKEWHRLARHNVQWKATCQLDPLLSTLPATDYHSLYRQMRASRRDTVLPEWQNLHFVVEVLSCWTRNPDDWPDEVNEDDSDDDGPTWEERAQRSFCYKKALSYQDAATERFAWHPSPDEDGPGQDLGTETWTLGWQCEELKAQPWEKDPAYRGIRVDGAFDARQWRFSLKVWDADKNRSCRLLGPGQMHGNGNVVIDEEDADHVNGATHLIFSSFANFEDDNGFVQRVSSAGIGPRKNISEDKPGTWRPRYDLDASLTLKRDGTVHIKLINSSPRWQASQHLQRYNYKNCRKDRYGRDITYREESGSISQRTDAELDEHWDEGWVHDFARMLLELEWDA